MSTLANGSAYTDPMRRPPSYASQPQSHFGPSSRSDDDQPPPYASVDSGDAIRLNPNGIRIPEHAGTANAGPWSPPDHSPPEDTAPAPDHWEIHTTLSSNVTDAWPLLTSPPSSTGSYSGHANSGRESQSDHTTSRSHRPSPPSHRRQRHPSETFRNPGTGASSRQSSPFTVQVRRSERHPPPAPRRRGSRQSSVSNSSRVGRTSSRVPSSNRFTTNPNGKTTLSWRPRLDALSDRDSMPSSHVDAPIDNSLSQPSPRSRTRGRYTSPPTTSAASQKTFSPIQRLFGIRNRPRRRRPRQNRRAPTRSFSTRSSPSANGSIQTPSQSVQPARFYPSPDDTASLSLPRPSHLLSKSLPPLPIDLSSLPSTVDPMTSSLFPVTSSSAFSIPSSPNISSPASVPSILDTSSPASVPSILDTSSTVSIPSSPNIPNHLSLPSILDTSSSISAPSTPSYLLLSNSNSALPCSIPMLAPILNARGRSRGAQNTRDKMILLRKQQCFSQPLHSLVRLRSCMRWRRNPLVQGGEGPLSGRQYVAV